jgi:hypothetical protein
MNKAWDIAKQMAERHTSSIFVRLANDGDKVVGVFVGEPYPREVVWTGEKYLDAKSHEADKHLKKGRSSSLRVATNLYIPAEKAVKVYEMGAVVFKDVFKLRDKYGLDTWAFEIERHGARVTTRRPIPSCPSSAWTMRCAARSPSSSSMIWRRC